MENKKIYFASDFHLGAPNYKASFEREKKIVSWLEKVSKDADEIYLLGDVFDFWFEYKTAVPKGYVRLLGKLAELSDADIKIHFFTGNHDMWVFDYLTEEIGIKMYREPIFIEINGLKLHIGHGDGLGPGDHSYKLLKKVFANKVCQWLFARLHPNFGIGLANYWSRKSRLSTGTIDEKFLGEEKEFLIQYCKDVLKEREIDIFLFGHRHLALDYQLTPKSRYINTGDWIKYNSYAELSGQEIELKHY